MGRAPKNSLNSFGIDEKSHLPKSLMGQRLQRVSLTAEGRGPPTNSSSCPSHRHSLAPLPGHKGVGDARGCTLEAQTAPLTAREAAQDVGQPKPRLWSEYTENLGERGLCALWPRKFTFVSKASHASN